MGTPLERELHGQLVNEYEPMSERARTIFKCYEQVRHRVLQAKKQTAMRRADLSNRRKYGKKVEVGDKVLVRDNRPGRTGGRTMCKSPLSEPATVTRVKGHRLQVKFADGNSSEVHLERVLQIPRGYYDPEHSSEIPPGPGAEVMPDVPVTGVPGAPAQEPGTVQRRSPGMMLEDDGRAVEEHAKVIKRGGFRPGSWKGLSQGTRCWRIPCRRRRDF